MRVRTSSQFLACPWCCAEPGSNTVHTLRYKETLCARESVEDFEGIIDRCDQCGVFWANPRYIEEEFPAFYGELSRKTDTLGKRLMSLPTRALMTQTDSRVPLMGVPTSLFSMLVEPLAMPPIPPRDFNGGRVLDVGCGDGFHLRCLASDKVELFGTEIHPGYAPVLSTGPERITHWIGNFNDIPWEQENLFCSFDLIIFQSVFYRVNDPVETHDLAWKLLRPGGTILRIEPYCPDLDAIKFMARFNFPQGFSFVHDVRKHAARIRERSPGAHVSHRVFYGRSLKHKTGKELTLLSGLYDAVTRLYKQLARIEPWFIRLEITKPKST